MDNVDPKGRPMMQQVYAVLRDAVRRGDSWSLYAFNPQPPLRLPRG